MSDLATMQAIAQLVPMGSRVLDLGCGDGALLAYLQKNRNCTGIVASTGGGRHHKKPYLYIS